MENELQSNVFKTALLFEGGSMRAAYTCAVVAYLLENGVYFDNVYGVSAGSSNACNYVSRDVDRAICSFTSFIQDPQMGDWKTLLAHKGLFNAHYIYQEAGLPDGLLPFDIDTFNANPARCTVVSFERDTGRDLFFRKEDLSTVEELMLRVRASSTLPFFMPPPMVNGMYCYDGGFADGGGLPIHQIRRDGFEKMVVIRTRKRGYRKEDNGWWGNVMFWHRAGMRNAVVTRPRRYNAACDELDDLERSGDAYVFYCDELTLSGTERDYDALCRNFASGYRQIQRDFGKLQDFLAKSEA